MALALNGGTPVSSQVWPRWPRAGETARRLIDGVLSSDRWSISGPRSDQVTLDQLASQAFARFCGTTFAYTVDHGSSALVAALLALEIGAGDEVIIPGLTWVACASAVLRVNAVPVPVDIDSRTLCLDPEAVARSVTARTKAILIVHLYGSMADMDALVLLARANGLATIEDCAQAHGAEWDGARAGSLGDVGTFSFHQGKPMSAGEGGMVVTNDPKLARKLEQIRCDGRRYGDARIGHQHLADEGEVQGFNFCMPELSSALLLDALERIELENEHRLANATLLDVLLNEIGAWRPVASYPKNLKRTYYHYAVGIDDKAFVGVSAAQLCLALEAELGVAITTPYPPMTESVLLRPDAYPAWRGTNWAQHICNSIWSLPRAKVASNTTVLLHHSVLLCKTARIPEIAEAFRKVAIHAGDLRGGATCNE